MTTPLVPLFIPIEVCDTVAAPPSTPVDQCMSMVKTALAENGVSAPAADVPGLKQVVADAREEGFDLKIVVIDSNPVIETPLRDIATDVGAAFPGSTVLAISPSFAGTYSPSFDRATLEAGQDLAKTGNAVQSSRNFLDQLTTPDFPWTALTVVLIIGVMAATAATRLLQLRSKRSEPAKSSSITAD